MSDHIVPADKRVMKAGRVFRMVREVDRCAAETAKGTQCENTLFGGEGGGEYDMNGERVPLCTVHLRKAISEGW